MLNNFLSSFRCGSKSPVLFVVCTSVICKDLGFMVSKLKKYARLERSRKARLVPLNDSSWSQIKQHNSEYQNWVDDKVHEHNTSVNLRELAEKKVNPANTWYRAGRKNKHNLKCTESGNMNITKGKYLLSSNLTIYNIAYL